MKNPMYDALFGPHAGRDTTFLHLPDGKILTHAHFLADADRMANALAKIGVKPGDRVAVRVHIPGHRKGAQGQLTFGLVGITHGGSPLICSNDTQTLCQRKRHQRAMMHRNHFNALRQKQSSEQVQHQQRGG